MHGRRKFLVHKLVFVLKNERRKKNDITYTAEDIKRYITGAMNPQEMHAIEMALDDPLLAEAWKGYDLMEQKGLEQRTGRFKTSFSKRRKTRNARYSHNPTPGF